MRKERHIPTGYSIHTETEYGVVYYNKELKGGKPIAIGFAGKRSKGSWHLIFQSEEQMENKINQFLTRLKTFKETSEKARKIRNERNKEERSKIKVGDLFVSSWGYEQTNVDFYQVIEKPTKQTFVIKEIAAVTVEGSTMSHGMACDVTPFKDHFLRDAKPIRLRSMKIDSFRFLSKTEEGESHYKSWYA